MKTWSCKIGEVDAERVPEGGDFPMRRAVEKAYHELTGEWPEFIFSGWGAELTDLEREALAFPEQASAGRSSGEAVSPDKEKE